MNVSHEHVSHEYPSFIKSPEEPEISSLHVQTQAERGVPISSAFLLLVPFYSWLFSCLQNTTWSIETSPQRRDLTQRVLQLKWRVWLQLFLWRSSCFATCISDTSLEWERKEWNARCLHLLKPTPKPREQSRAPHSTVPGPAATLGSLWETHILSPTQTS